jgi:hypothetical protein
MRIPAFPGFLLIASKRFLEVTMEFYGGYEVYLESGVDLTLLRERLKMTVTERWQANARALQVVEAMHNAKHAQRRSDSSVAGREQG